MKLTADQQHIVDLDEGAFLVQAPPGAGKTTVLTERIARILRATPNESFHVLALTFTTKAADNLKERIDTELPGTRNRIDASTFHAFALDTLRAYGDIVGFTSKVTPYSNNDETRRVLLDAIEQNGVELATDPKLRKQQIDAFADSITRHKRELLAAPSLDDHNQEAEVYRTYNATLASYGKCDYDDLLYTVWRLFVEAPKIAKHLRRIHRYIMVDEAQDTSRVQYEILRALCGETHRNVMLVADYNQAINAFAGASAKWLAAFLDDFGGQKKELRSNFRSARQIVELARSLCPSESQPTTYAAGWVGLAEQPTSEQEALFVVDWINGLVTRGLPLQWLEAGETSALQWRDCVVLARHNDSLSAVRAELERRGIASVFAGASKGIVATAHAKVLLTLLRLIQNPRDGLAREQLQELVKVERDLDTTLSIGEFLQALTVTKGGARVAEVHAELASLTDVGELLGRGLQLLRELKKPAVSADVDALQAYWDSYKQGLLPTQRSLDGYIGHLSLQGRRASDEEGVRLMSIHAAKGLEFKVVALIGMNEGTLPDYRATSDAKVEEERRLMYVATTRAARGLLITRPESVTTRYGTTKTQLPSRFLADLGLEALSAEEIARAARTTPPEEP